MTGEISGRNRTTENERGWDTGITIERSVQGEHDHVRGAVNRSCGNGAMKEPNPGKKLPGRQTRGINISVVSGLENPQSHIMIVG